MRIIRIGNLSIKIPASWSEMTGKQLLAVFALNNNVYLDANEFKIKVLTILLNLPKRYLKKIDKYQLFDLLPLTDFLFTEYNSTKNQLASIRIRHRSFLGPDDALENITVEEAGVIAACFSDYKKTQDDKYLYKIAATIYREKKWFASIRSRFNKKTTDWRQELLDITLSERTAYFVQYLSKDILQLILKFVTASMKATEEEYKELFTNPESASSSYGTAELVADLAGDKWGKIEDVMHANYKSILFYLVICEAKRKRQEFEQSLNKHR